jgi:flavodoxin
MKTIVIYASRYGNTHRVAEAIVSALRNRGSALLLAADDTPDHLPEGTDLLIVGGPTEQHGMTEAITGLFARLGPDALSGIPAAAFDTRLRWPHWLSGSAAAGIAHRLRAAEANVIAPEESFFIKGVMGTGGRNTAELDAGELERAAAWAVSLAERMEAKSPAMSGTTT